MALIQYDHYTYEKVKKTGRRTYEDEGRDLGDPLTSQGILMISSKQAEARRGGTDSPSQQKEPTCGHLILDFHPLKW